MKFMWKMKSIGGLVLHEYAIRRNIGSDDAFLSLASECDSCARTLPKLLDEYNWVKFNNYNPQEN